MQYRVPVRNPSGGGQGSNDPARPQQGPDPNCTGRNGGLVRGIYTAASAMITEMAKQDIIANNLANMDTTGFKQDAISFRARMDQTIYGIAPGSSGGNPSVQKLGLLSTGTTVDRISVDYAQGNLRPTSNPLDLGLRGAGFFTIQTPQGLAYTRNGSFQLNNNRILVDSEGNPVLSTSGLIQLPPTGQFHVAQDGTVSAGAQIVGRLRLADFANRAKQLVKRGNSYYQMVSGTELPATGAAVQQGSLEQSTVNPISEMVDMITALRGYESSQKALQTEDSELGRAVNDIARM